MRAECAGFFRRIFCTRVEVCSQRFGDYRPVKDRFKQIALGGDGLRCAASRSESFCRNNKRFIRRKFGGLTHEAIGTSALASRLKNNVPDAQLADMSVMSRIECVGQPQNRGQLNSRFLLIGQQIAQIFMSARRQRTAVESCHERCLLHDLRI